MVTCHAASHERLLREHGGAANAVIATIEPLSRDQIRAYLAFPPPDTGWPEPSFWSPWR